MTARKNPQTRSSANPYGWQHQRRRAAVLRPGVVCHRCGEPASELDHDPPLALHHHIENSGCCRSLPACGACQRKQGAELGFAGHWTPPQPAVELVEEQPDSAPADDPSWDALPWLERWRDVPRGARWPRFMSGAHPSAIGSFGGDALEWLRSHADLELRWWQQLWLVRQLEYDEAGQLVWLDVLVSCARQSGKSTGLRAISSWRLHQAGLFGEQQTILHTAKDLPVCKEVQRPAMEWAASRGYPVRRSNGDERIEEPASGSRWIIRGRGSVYGYPASLVIGDEAWGMAPEIVEDGLEPTMAERTSPQLLLASTAHRRATALYPTRRHAALEEIDDPVSTLLLEWSVPRTAEITDREAWRCASPHWSANRQRLLEARLRRVEVGETLDPDEDDPIESFRAQYLNIWPVRSGPRLGERLVADGVWEQLRQDGISSDGPVWVAVEDNYGDGAAVAVVARLGAGRFEIDGWCCDTWAEALDSARAVCEWRDGSKLIVGQAIFQRIPDVRPRPARAGSTETRTGLALLRELVRTGAVIHDETPELDEQVGQARVRAVASGGLALISSRRADIVRAAVWALREAQQQKMAPAIH